MEVSSISRSHPAIVPGTFIKIRLSQAKLLAGSCQLHGFPWLMHTVHSMSGLLVSLQASCQQASFTKPRVLQPMSPCPYFIGCLMLCALPAQMHPTSSCFSAQKT